MEWTASELAAAIRARRLSVVEVVDAFIARIEALNPQLNAVVASDFEAARSQAAAAQRLVDHGAPAGPLHGVPVTVKVAVAARGLPWNDGCRLSFGSTADRDADCVRRLRAAGAIVLGKTNVPEFCGWYDTDNDVYGRTQNPYAPDRSPGGSSGGEAAALAARLSPLGVGSDLGSSIRQPAAWCGVLGFKPSRDVVSNDGHFGFGLRLFATIGPMARSVADLGLSLAVMAARPLAPPSSQTPRVAVFEEDEMQPVSTDCRLAVRRAAEVLAAEGVPVEDGLPPGLADVRRMYDSMLATELSVLALPTLEGRQHELSAYGSRMAEGLAGFTPDLAAYLTAGTRLSELEAAVDEWLEAHPIVLCPVVPTTAPVAADGLVDVDGEPFRPGGKLTLCTWANTLGLPAASVPSGTDGAGLPLAVQVVGRRGCDADVLAVAARLERGLGGVLDPPVQPRLSSAAS
ncbi:MAG: amidase [Gaiellales bacterium]